MNQKHYASSLYNGLQSCILTFTYPSGSTALQLNPSAPATDFVDSSEVKSLIQLKGYFKGSSIAWNDALDSVMQPDVALCALGGLISHLSRMMVCLLYALFSTSLSLSLFNYVGP